MLDDAAEVMHRVEAEFDALSPELQRAARWLREQGPAVAMQSMRQSAHVAGVAPATMTRLARKLGFADFDSLRASCARQLVSGPASPPRRRTGARPGNLADQLAALHQAQIGHVTAVSARNPTATLQAAAKALLKAQRVGFFGQRISHGVAFQLHYGYGLLAPQGMLLGDVGGTLPDQLATFGPGTMLVAISQSPYTRTVVEAVARVLQQGAMVTALTDSPLSPIARGATHTLYYGGGTPALLHSTCGALALAEVLLASVAHVGGTAVQAHWAARQRQLALDRAYHESPRDTP